MNGSKKGGYDLGGLSRGFNRSLNLNPGNEVFPGGVGKHYNTSALSAGRQGRCRQV